MEKQITKVRKQLSTLCKNGKIELFVCGNCKRHSFKNKCWTCIDKNKKHEMKIAVFTEDKQ